MVYAQVSVPNPQLIKDIYAGANGSSPSGMVRAGKYVFFTASDTINGAGRLFRTDATTAGTTRLLLTSPGFISSTADHLTKFGNKVVFAVDNGSGYYEVWVSDGTQAGTYGIENYVSTAGSLGGFYTAGNYIYYSVHKNDTIQLRRMDTTCTKSTLIKSFGVDHSGGFDCVVLKSVNNNKVYFDYFSPTDYTDQIWVTDGTTAGTTMIKKLDTEGLESELMPSGKYLYFLTTTGSNEMLYAIDAETDNINSVTFFSGTPGTQFPDNISLSNDGYNDTRLLFTFNDGIHGKEPWITDGTAEGTHLLTDIETGSASSSPKSYIAVGDKIIFSAYNSNYGSELWYTNTTATTCSLFQDIFSGAGSSSPAELTPIGLRFVFAASTGNNTGNELFIADSTAGSAAMLADINSGTAGSLPHGFTKSGFPVCFAASQANTGNEIYALNDITKIWTGKINTDWSNAGNWSPASVPTNTDNVMLPFGIGVSQPNVTLNNNSSCDELWLNGGTFTVATGKTLNILNNPPQSATVSTAAVTNLGSNYFTIGGSVSNDGGATVSERGVVWDVQTNPVITNTNKIISGAGTGSFSASVHWLNPNTSYHVRAYAVNAKGVTYGNDVVVTTTL